ncbi:hypothetical protein UACE39S_06139 [Ureibacillus acetophenoni]
MVYKIKLEEIYRIINEHNKPFVHVIGNHDSYALSKVEMLEITKQERYRAIHNDQLSLVFLDTAKEQDYKSWGGISRRQAIRVVKRSNRGRFNFKYDCFCASSYLQYNNEF